MSQTLENLIGKTYGRLTVVDYAERAADTHARWLCKCQCGNETIVRNNNIKRGIVKSCGCLASELTSERSKVHGMTKTNVYRQWKVMRQRCYLPTNISYKNYGARGITVCDEWKNNFEAYYSYVSKLPNFRKKGYSIDRIDNDGNYEPGNLRYATAKQQRDNQTQRKHGISGYYGIVKWKHKWRAHYKQKHIGVFETIEEALKEQLKYINNGSNSKTT
jgi:hypothetical protein